MQESIVPYREVSEHTSVKIKIECTVLDERYKGTLCMGNGIWLIFHLFFAESTRDHFPNIRFSLTLHWSFKFN